MIAPYIRRTLNAWFARRARRALRKAVPQLAALDMRRTEIARAHRAGAKRIDAERKRLVTERLRHELGMG